MVSGPTVVVPTGSLRTTITFSEGNRVAHFSNGLGSVAGAALPSTGNWYWEQERVSGNYLMAGISAAPMGTHLHAFGCGMAIGEISVGALYAGSNATKYPVAGTGSGARFGFAFDAGTRTLHMYHGTVYRGSCTVSGTSPLYLTALNGSSSHTSSVRAHFRPEHQSLATPAGFTAGVQAQ